MKVEDYGDWSLGVHQRLSTKRIPISGSIEVTQRCNNHCIHCYNNLSAGDRQAAAAELSLNEHYRILDEIVDAGCLWLLLTGGEIFLRRDFLDIYAYARQKGLLITLFTNGTLVSRQIADQLIRLPPFSIEITIYGRTKETYESVTQVPGSYEQCINGIRMLMARKLPLKLKTMATARNLHEIHDLKRFVEQDLGLEFKFDAMINPRLDCSQSPLEVRLTPAQVVELDLRYSERACEWQYFAERFLNSENDTPRQANLYVCGAGHNSYAIDPYGKLRLCILSAGESFDLRDGGFREGWDKHLTAARQKKNSRQTKCTKCLLRPMCGVCPANSQLECSDEAAPVDFLCRVAHLRAYALELPVAPHGACEYCKGGSGYAAMIETANKLKGLRAED